MRKIMEAEAVEDALRDQMSVTIADIETELERVGAGVAVDPLNMIAEDKREAYRQVFGLIYECSANRVAAKSLVDKIIQRLTA
jgi:hypothetical protein